MRTPVVRLKMKDVFKSFKIDLRGFYKNRVYVQHHLHIQPSEIDDLCYYEYQWMVVDLVEMIKEQNGDQNNSQQSAQDYMDQVKMDTSSYTKGFGNNLPKLGNFKMPKL
jgi:hypothetical protein